MCERILEQFLEVYPFHFVLKTNNGNPLERIHQLSMHQEILEVSPGEFLLFFSEDRAMNACLKRIQTLLKEIDSSLAFF